MQGNGVLNSMKVMMSSGSLCKHERCYSGKEVPSKHTRCDDYFNCFTLEGEAARYILLAGNIERTRVGSDSLFALLFIIR